RHRAQEGGNGREQAQAAILRLVLLPRLDGGQRSGQIREERYQGRRVRAALRDQERGRLRRGVALQRLLQRTVRHAIIGSVSASGQRQHALGRGQSQS